MFVYLCYLFVFTLICQDIEKYHSTQQGLHANNEKNPTIKLPKYFIFSLMTFHHKTKLSLPAESRHLNDEHLIRR